MNPFECWKPSLVLLFIAAVGTVSWTAEMSADKAAIAKSIRSDVAQVVAGIKAHDADKTTAFDAPDIISMECGSPSTVGVQADREGFKTGFAHDPFWKVSLIDETVDVAISGDLAVYRGSYNEESSNAGVAIQPVT